MEQMLEEALGRVEEIASYQEVLGVSVINFVNCLAIQAEERRSWYGGKSLHAQSHQEEALRYLRFP